MAIQSSSAIRFTPLRAVTRRPTATSRAADVVRFPSGIGRRGARSLSLCRSAPVMWWTPDVCGPVDPIEPEGQGMVELDAIWGALVRDPLRPFFVTLREIVAARGNLLRCRHFHAGIVSGPLLLAAGFCKLYKLVPTNLAMDLVLGYIFYKLSVLASDLQKNRKSNRLCSRIQCVIIVLLCFKCNNPTKDLYYRFTEFIWGNACFVYLSTIYFECIGTTNPREEMETLGEEIVTFIGRVLKRMVSG